MATARLQSESEANLVARIRGGEPEAFYELIQPHERGIYLAALSIVNNDADAEEVVQEAILKAFKAIGGFRAASKFSNWMIQIAMNEARMKLRKDRCLEERTAIRESTTLVIKSEDQRVDVRPGKGVREWRKNPSKSTVKKCGGTSRIILTMK
jgi:RNA polymerase sigma-70 factor, ECF subfamily